MFSLVSALSSAVALLSVSFEVSTLIGVSLVMFSSSLTGGVAALKNSEFIKCPYYLCL